MKSRDLLVSAVKPGRLLGPPLWGFYSDSTVFCNLEVTSLAFSTWFGSQPRYDRLVSGSLLKEVRMVSWSTSGGPLGRSGLHPVKYHEAHVRRSLSSLRTISTLERFMVNIRYWGYDRIGCIGVIIG